ncbi:hydantoinase/oxoprolinase family protein [Brevibacillus humidisoli]|uniref:hydantoinase/oxoprolinase family protein n=1 Tax=Brevibacillus humidisoli TaxID=2895522 RepID=UPI001E4F37FC|nr:hydantoinase/oxoprolinase family protein [Brevibacillus humidisoli]UFJ40775.1 hydantoinase/oxoprolinase family protein [Brevibacillus humidisoli]
MRVAVDIGGTFTDLVYLDELTGRVGMVKADTTPPHFEQGVLHVIQKAGLQGEQIDFFVHGSTVVINALTERKGAVTGLITTKGFRDVLEIGRANRPDLFNLAYRKPVPFVPRHLRQEVNERLTHKGEVLRDLDTGEIDPIVQHFREQGVTAIAVCLLHAYKNPLHERMIVDYIKQQWPEVAVTASHEITKEWREYERTNTAVLNSYVMPLTARYLDKLEQHLVENGARGRKTIMQSNGGITTFEHAKQAPINLVESGPVAGMYGAAVLGRLLGYDNVIALDIGGTTAKCSLIQEGEISITTDYKIEWDHRSAGYPIKVPVVDIVEIGNGGGSIAWLDEGNALHVGPKSAGSMPGPACYGRGGSSATTTDANLVIGRLNKDNFLGGEIEADLEAARRAIQPIADAYGTSVEEAALGIVRKANANMVNALKLISIRRGHDPRDYTMVAIGGGGPMHAMALARELQIQRIVIPVASAVFSAWGMLMSDLRQDWIGTFNHRLSQLSESQWQQEWDRVKAEAYTSFAEQGVTEAEIVFSLSVDMRYLGQEHTVKVSVPECDTWEELTEQLVERFHQLHEQHYSYRLPESETEIVNLHLTGWGLLEKPPMAEWTQGGLADEAIVERRHVHLDEFGWQEIPVYQRDRLAAGEQFAGPAIVEEPSSSAVIYPDQQCRVDRYGNLIVEGATRA